jgi:hypothetical protein
MVAPDKLTPRQVLAVRCPVCLAVPREKCTLSTGKPCVKTHMDRRLLAGKMAVSENFGQAAVRIVKHATSRTFGILFPQR